MPTQTKESFIGPIAEVHEHSALPFLDEVEEEFFEAFCELLEIEAQRRGDPIVVLPAGPGTLH